ncbi:MAG: TetR/AcrR family transcriptional regulator, partial [Actinomycetota bacterium]
MAGRRGSSKDAIIAAAADLIHLRGVAGTSIDDILKASGTGKSQFYYYFESKDELIHEVLRFQLERYIAAQQPFIENLASWKGISDWLEALVDQHEGRKLVGGCPIGSLAAEMADRDERLREQLVDAFDRWESYLVVGLQ